MFARIQGFFFFFQGLLLLRAPHQVFTLPLICMNDMSTKPRSGLVAFLLAAAIVDAAWEPVSERSSLLLTVGFAILHLGAIKVGQTGMFGGWSCV